MEIDRMFVGFSTFPHNFWMTTQYMRKFVLPNFFESSKNAKMFCPLFLLGSHWGKLYTRLTTPATLPTLPNLAQWTTANMLQD